MSDVCFVLAWFGAFVLLCVRVTGSSFWRLPPLGFAILFLACVACTGVVSHHCMNYCVVQSRYTGLLVPVRPNSRLLSCVVCVARLLVEARRSVPGTRSPLRASLSSLRSRSKKSVRLSTFSTLTALVRQLVLRFAALGRVVAPLLAPLRFEPFAAIFTAYGCT